MTFKIHIIAPYPSMVPIIEECIAAFSGINIRYSVGDLEKGAQVATREELRGTDIIISRGGTAQLIRKSVTIPVIDMQLSGYDLLRSLTLASNTDPKTAIVGFSNITSGATSIIDLLDFPITVYTVNDSKEVAPLLLQLKESGYQRILGDVVTVDTSRMFGLQGMLLQSGKESIIKSIEQALFLYTHLNRIDKVTHTLEQFILDNHSNIIVLDEKNQIIYEHFQDFESNPLSQENLYILNTNLTANPPIHQTVNLGENQLAVTGHRYKLEEQDYKLYTLSKKEIEPRVEKGLYYHRQIASEPLAVKSDSMSAFVTKLTTLYEAKEPICIHGEKGTGKKFIVRQIHNQEEGLLVTVDGAAFTKDKLSQLLDSSISTIHFTNVSDLLVDPAFSLFIKKCKEQQIRVVVTAEEGIDLDRMEELSMNLLLMPTIQDRKEDIHDLALFFLADSHQKHGTKPVKITDEARHVLENHPYKNHIASLKSLIKQVALNEEDYMIHKETIEKVKLNLQENAPLPLQGTLKEMESAIVNQTLMEEGNNQTKAAKRLGISRSTLWRKLKG